MLRKLFMAFVIILIFTGADWVGHSYLEKNYQLEQVPEQYYYNKVIYGTAILFIILLFISRLIFSRYTRVFIITALVVLALQFRYYSAYSLRFNYIVLALHYVILAPIIYISQEKGYV